MGFNDNRKRSFLDGVVLDGLVSRSIDSTSTLGKCDGSGVFNKHPAVGLIGAPGNDGDNTACPEMFTLGTLTLNIPFLRL